MTGTTTKKTATELKSLLSTAEADAERLNQEREDAIDGVTGARPNEIAGAILELDRINMKYQSACGEWLNLRTQVQLAERNARRGKSAARSTN